MDKNIVHLVGLNDNYSPDIYSLTPHWQKFRYILFSWRAQLIKTDDMLSSKKLFVLIVR